MSESAVKCESELRIAYIPIDNIGLDLDSDRDDLTAFIGFMENDGYTANLKDIAESITIKFGLQISASLFSLLP